jgi:hypothetical protein
MAGFTLARIRVGRHGQSPNKAPFVTCWANWHACILIEGMITLSQLIIRQLISSTPPIDLFCDSHIARETFQPDII